MSRFLTLLWYDLLLALRDRLNLVFSFLLPVLLMVLMGIAFGGGLPFVVNMGVVDEDRSELTRTVIAEMRKVDGIRIFEGEERAELAALRKGDRTAVAVFPAGFEFGTVGFETSLVLYEDSTDPQNVRVAVTIVRTVLSELQEQVGAREYSLERRGIRGIRFRYLDFMAPGILGLAIMNLGVLGAIATLVTYREQGLLRRIRVTPTPLWAFIAGQALVRLLLAAVQVFIIIGVATIGFGVHVSGSMLALVVIAIIGSAVFVNLGIIASSAANTFQTAQTVGLILTVPTVFICGVFIPTETMPGILQPLIQVLPLTHLNSALRQVVMRGATLAEVSSQLAILVALAVGSFLAALRLFRWE